MSKNILKTADEIINNRSEEKERMYGPFEEGMRRAAMICSGMTGKEGQVPTCMPRSLLLN